MDDAQRHSILSLLYAVVLIDNRVVKVEVDLFFARIEDFLKRANDIETLKAKSVISTWFVQNYKHILTEMKSPNRDIFIFKHVENLKLYTYRQDVYDMMTDIALSDDEYHDDERRFLDKVSNIWMLSPKII